MGNVSRFGLEKEEEISIFLSLFIVGKEPFLEIGSIFKMACDLILLETKVSIRICTSIWMLRTSSNAMRF